MKPTQSARLTLTIGLVVVLGWFGIDKFIHPDNWIAWIPEWTENLLGIAQTTWLLMIGAFEALLALGLCIPWKGIQHWISLLATIHLTAIVFAIGWDDIGIRDAGLTCAASALWYLSKPTKTP